MGVPLPSLRRKLDPARFPNMSLEFAAVLGFVLERAYTTPVLADLKVTPDGHVLIWPAGEGERVGHAIHLGAEAELRANLRRLAMAADLDDVEWAELARRVHSRLGISLDAPGEGDAR